MAAQIPPLLTMVPLDAAHTTTLKIIPVHTYHVSHSDVVYASKSIAGF